MSAPSAPREIRDRNLFYPRHAVEIKSLAIWNKNKKYLLRIHESENTKTLRQNAQVHCTQTLWVLIYVQE